LASVSVFEAPVSDKEVSVLVMSYVPDPIPRIVERLVLVVSCPETFGPVMERIVPALDVGDSEITKRKARSA